MLASMPGMPSNSGKVALVQKWTVQGMKLNIMMVGRNWRGGSWARLIPLASCGSTASRKNLKDGRL